MKSERLWIVLLSITFFLAGGAAGILVALERNPLHPVGRSTAYQERMIEAYDLDEVRAARLAQIMAAFDEQIETLKARQLRDLDEELVKAGNDCSARIARYIVPEDRREEFELLAQGRFQPQAPPQ